MTQQAQIDALEHLVMALLKRTRMTLQANLVFEDAEASIMGSDGPPGTTEKVQAREHLDHLKQQLK